MSAPATLLCIPMEEDEILDDPCWGADILQQTYWQV